MKIYTKTGDEGETGLYAGPRVFKDDPRIEAYGTVDELSACLGVARTLNIPNAIDELLVQIQHQLFCLGAELASPDNDKQGTPTTQTKDIEILEASIDRFEAGLSPLTTFILPGGAPAAAALHQARVVCRRAERRVVSLARGDVISQLIVPYLNRLSDLLFVLSRAANADAGHADVPWKKPE